MELRCQANTLHGVVADGRLERVCRDRKCGYVPGRVTVMHYFDLKTGQLVDTTRFADVNRVFARNQHKKEKTA